jgi:hypothetical protein
MKYLKSYQLFEAHGVAEATLIYNQFLLDEFNKYCDIALESGEKNYSKTVDYSQEDLAQFIQSNLWPKYPISSMEVTYTLQTMTDEDWIKRFPTAKKKYIGTGACYNIDEEGGSSIQPGIDDRSDVTLHLVLEIGALISDAFTDREGLSIEVESSITHELNHGYEGWNRIKKGKGQVSTDVTWALDVNRSKIRKDIWKIWYDEIGFYVYWSELHEINAMTQDAFPYVKRYDIEEVKQKAPSWKFATKMKEFDANQFKQKMTDKILSVYPDADVEMMLRRIKNGFANELIKNRENSISRKEDKPTLSGESVKSMSVDKFLTFIQKRINRAGNKIQRNITKLYSLKNNTLL